MRLILRACDGLTVAEIPWDTTKHTGCPDIVIFNDRVYDYDLDGRLEGDPEEPIYVETSASTYAHPKEVVIDGVEWKYADAITKLADDIKRHKDRGTLK